MQHWTIGVYLILLRVYASLQGHTDFVADQKKEKNLEILTGIMQSWSNLAEDMDTSHKNPINNKAFRGVTKTAAQATKMETFAKVSIFDACGDSRNVSAF